MYTGSNTLKEWIKKLMKEQTFFVFTLFFGPFRAFVVFVTGQADLNYGFGLSGGHSLFRSAGGGQSPLLTLYPHLCIE